MGIFIFTAVSKSVTEKEWEKVYRETLTLVEAFPFAERGVVTYAGRDIVCAVRTKEKEMPFGEPKQRGWCTTMDYVSLNGAEEYYIPEKLVDDRKLNPSAGDASLRGSIIMKTLFKITGKKSLRTVILGRQNFRKI